MQKLGMKESVLSTSEAQLEPSRKRKLPFEHAKRKRRKYQDEEAYAHSFFPHRHFPEELEDYTIEGYRDLAWSRFLKAYTLLGERQAEWFEFPTTPHKNTLRILTEQLLADATESGEIISYETFSKSSLQDSNEIDLFGEDLDPNAIDLFGEEEEEEEEVQAASPKTVMNKIELKVDKKPLKRSSNIFAELAETKKTMEIDNVQRIVCWGVFQYEWLLLHLNRYLYVKYKWNKAEMEGGFFRRALKAFSQSMNVTREILRLRIKRPQVNIFMKEVVSQQELKNLQKDCPPNVPMKFWAQRYRLFSKYDQGIRLTSVASWFSVTPEAIANHIGQRFRDAELVVDAFCGQGGNSIALAKTCKRVISIDILQESVDACLHNAKVYGVDHKITGIVANFFNEIPKLKPDLIFLAPPWGGMQYEQGIFNVEDCEGINLFEVVEKILEVSPNASMAMALPRNCDFVQLSRFSKQFEYFEIEQNFLWGKCKMWTVYVGPFFQARSTRGVISKFPKKADSSKNAPPA